MYGLIGLLLPPSLRLSMGQEHLLKQDCQQTNTVSSPLCVFCWEPNIDVCDYTLVTRLFEVFMAGEPTTLWFPRLDKTKALMPLIQLLRNNSQRLGGIKLDLCSWPQTPTTRIEITFSTCTDVGTTGEGDNSSGLSSVQSSIQATEDWVEQKLCKLGLCPYTYSMKRAAVGLDAVGVKEGPIIISHSIQLAEVNSSSRRNKSTLTPATILAHAFWQSVSKLVAVREEELSTFLILAPPVYDSDFVEFAATFDQLIEPSVQAAGAESIVGRALFHPLYDTESIGHTQVLPGHALPAKMVEGFIDEYHQLATDETIGALKKPEFRAVMHANNAVRWTPHATINLLRRSQLKASKVAEAAMPNKKPNWIYVRNVQRILKSSIFLNQ